MNLLSFFLLLALIALLVAAVYRLYRDLKAKDLAFAHAMQNLRYEMGIKLQPLELNEYERLPGTEVPVYDGRTALANDDFRGGGGQVWDYVGHRFANGAGNGSHAIENRTLRLERTNTAGRYELHLNRYLIDGQTAQHIPAATERKQRHLRLSFQVKKESASHQLRVVFKGETSKEVLSEKDYVVFSPEWETVNLVFAISTAEACTLRIDDLHVLNAPSRIWLRDLVLWEKK